MEETIKQNKVIGIIYDIQKKGILGSSEFWKLAISKDAVLFYLPTLAEKMEDIVPHFIASKTGMIGGYITGMVMERINENSKDVFFEDIKNVSKTP